MKKGTFIKNGLFNAKVWKMVPNSKHFNIFFCNFVLYFFVEFFPCFPSAFIWFRFYIFPNILLYFFVLRILFYPFIFFSFIGLQLTSKKLYSFSLPVARMIFNLVIKNCSTLPLLVLSVE